MKFKAGDEVNTPWGEGIVDRVDPDCDRDPPLQYYVKHSRGAGWHEEGELEPIQPKPATIKTTNDKLRKAFEERRILWRERAEQGETEISLTEPAKEPVPGRFYRTRDGSKFKFLMKATKSYLYESQTRCYGEPEFFVYEFERPYHRYLDGKTYDEDIVGEWTEAITLPSLEIKRWAVVCNEKGPGMDRGEVVCIFPSYERAHNHCGLGSEIVELTGTLPERKQGN